MASTRRHTPTLKVKKSQVESLKRWSEGMTSMAKRSFELDYGLILNLLHVEIDDMALTTLAQFYSGVSPFKTFSWLQH
jgi:hypothetical protein